MNLVDATQSIRNRGWPRYTLAILLSLLALWVRLAIGGSLDGYPFLTFFAAVALAAFLGGLGPGILAALLSLLLADYYLIEPVGSLALRWPSGWTAVGFYVFTTVTIVGLSHGMLTAHGAQQESETALKRLNLELESRVSDRTAALQKEMVERSEAEASVRQLQKMESVGQLTGGIAHDFNNMLAIVIGSLDMARRRLSGQEHSKVLECIDNASEGAARAAELTARLLAFSRQQPLAPQSLDVNKLVQGMSELLQRTIGEHIRIETSLTDGLWRAFADRSQLETAIINLAVNARDAMPVGGTLTIETANSELDAHATSDHDGVVAGQYVLICVSDSGIGMTPEVMERAFEPFYTTKDVGKGTGLGLSQIFGYVEQSGGLLKLNTEVGMGTAVRIYLPRHLGNAPPATESRQIGDELPMGKEDQVILVVEDELKVSEMTVSALGDLGYSVISARNAEEALAQLAQHPHVDLVFTDIVMPGMNGRQLADKVRKLRPSSAILFTTGYMRNAVVHDGVLDAGVSLLPKPFTIEQLALKVAEVLADRGAGPS